MAGALLKFDGGYLGFERCTDPKDEKQYLRAVIYSSARGLTTTAPVALSDVMTFATESVRQALLADGRSEDEIKDMLIRLPHTNAERY